MGNERNDALLQAQFRAVQATAARKEPQDEADPVGQVLTSLMRHGGVYSLTDPEMMAARMTPLMMSMHGTATEPHLVTEQQLTPKQISSFVSSVSSTAASFFQHLVQGYAGKDLSYAIPSSLMSHIAFPGTGTAYKDPTGGPESPEIPAAFTFVGQFVDHDLTMNAVNLFEPQTGTIQDTASPLIDLDSVYGPRVFLSAPSKKIYNSDGSFRLEDYGTYKDLTRDTQGNAYISDKRNDENQMVLQVHLLVMRVHNKLIASGMSLPDAYKETLFNWQSVLLHDYLTRILEDGVRQSLFEEIAKPDFGSFKYKPVRDLTDGKLIASMPHEFAIGFRFGHSQLKSKYMLQSGGDLIPLFDNSLTSSGGSKVNTFADLRGSQKLAADHVIDWQFFSGGAFKGNRIDSKVTPIVADLPESAIPDDIKYIGNLVHRNLIRSRLVGLCAGEDLAELYGFGREHLPTSVIEPDESAHHLFLEGGKFRTPLWYYLLKEAEHAGTAKSSTLGKVGSRIVGEVILGAIKWAEHSVMNEPGWKSKITGTDVVTLLDLASFV
jgi:hypothetical protein